MLREHKLWRDPAAIYGPGECKRVYCRRRSLEIRIFAIKQLVPETRARLI